MSLTVVVFGEVDAGRSSDNADEEVDAVVDNTEEESVADVHNEDILCCEEPDDEDDEGWEDNDEANEAWVEGGGRDGWIVTLCVR